MCAWIYTLGTFYMNLFTSINVTYVNMCLYVGICVHMCHMHKEASIYVDEN